MQVKAAGQTFHGQVVPVFPADGLDNWGEALQIGTAGGHGGFLPRLPAKPRVTQKQGGQQAAGAVLPLLPSLLQLGSGLPRQIDQPMIRRQAGAGRRAVPRQAGQSARVPAEQPLRAKGDEQPATGWLSYAAGLMELAGIKKADAEKRAKELLEMVGLPDKANAYPAQLSGGQKQRIAIARALATNPKVLLCDEATSALDPNTTHSILTLIKDINRKLGITVVVITHQMSVVEEICDHVAILDSGVVVEQGEVKEIFANPKTAAAKRLVAPNGGSAARDLSSFAPDDHVVRVTFNGSSTAKPLVASLAAEKGILVSVLSADTRDLSGQCYGSMLLKLPREIEQAKQATAYMRAQPGVTVEEVTGE